MVGDARRRVLVVFETHWDRKQLEACRGGWEARAEIAYAPPGDADCAWDFDVIALIERAARAGLGRIDAVLSSSDYPGAIIAAAIATRLGLPGPRPERVIAASHKYYSRIAQRRAAPEAVPRFALVDPRHPEAELPIGFPCFVKPVKGSFSVLARRVESAGGLAEFLRAPALREFTGEYMYLFGRLVRSLTTLGHDGSWFIAEELLHGRPATVEGYSCSGEAQVLGIVDSGLDPATRSFVRFDYPSQLPGPVQARMAGIACRVARELGLERTLWNVEMTWDEATDRVAIIEVNPRLCGQFADLYQKVDGTSGYEVALALALGERPRSRRREGVFAAAASFPLRVFEECRVLAAPGPAEIAAAERELPGALVWSECSVGEELAHFEQDEDGASHRYAIANLGGASRADLDARLAALRKRLRWDFAVSPGFAGSGVP
jgi:biotin carboxylase